jgi:hypothetical protein
MTEEEYQQHPKEYPQYRVDLTRAIDDLKAAVRDAFLDSRIGRLIMRLLT